MAKQKLENLLKLQSVGGSKQDINDGFNEIKSYLEKKEINVEDINDLKDADGKNLLLFATIYLQWDIVRILINTPGVKLDVKHNGSGIVHYVTMTNDVENLECLDGKKDIISMLTSDGRTALHIATQWEYNLEVIQKLIELGVDVNIKDDKSLTALHYAVENESVECIKELVKAGAKLDIQNRDGKTAIQIAKELKKQDLIDALNPVDNKPIFEAIDKNDLAALTKLLSGDLKVLNCIGKDALTPIEYAAAKGNLEALKVLEKKQNVEYTALCRVAAKYGQINILNYISKNPLYSSSMNYALSDAVHEGQLDSIRYLMQNGATGNNLNGYGNTPLHIAAKYGSNDVVKVLLEGNETDDFYKFKTAALISLGDTREVISESKKDFINLKNSSGQSALLMALTSDNETDEVIKTLLRAGAEMPDINKVEGLTQDQKNKLVALAEVKAEQNPALQPVIHPAKSDDKALEDLKKLLEDQDFAGSDLTDAFDCVEKHLENNHYIVDDLYNRYNGKLLIEFAVSVGNKKAFTKLLEVMSLTPNGYRALYTQAASAGNWDMMQIIPAEHIEQNVKSAALILAADQNHSDIVRNLMTQNAQIGTFDYHGSNALHIAATKGHTKVIEVLLEKDENNPIYQFNLVNSAQINPIVINMTIDKCNNKTEYVNSQDTNKKSALFRALESTESNDETIKLLLKAGATKPIFSESQKDKQERLDKLEEEIMKEKSAANQAAGQNNGVGVAPSAPIPSASTSVIPSVPKPQVPVQQPSSKSTAPEPTAAYRNFDPYTGTMFNGATPPSGSTTTVTTPASPTTSATPSAPAPAPAATGSSGITPPQVPNPPAPTQVGKEAVIKHMDSKFKASFSLKSIIKVGLTLARRIGIGAFLFKGTKNIMSRPLAIGISAAASIAFNYFVFEKGNYKPTSKFGKFICEYVLGGRNSLEDQKAIDAYKNANNMADDAKIAADNHPKQTSWTDLALGTRNTRQYKGL